MLNFSYKNSYTGLNIPNDGEESDSILLQACLLLKMYMGLYCKLHSLILSFLVAFFFHWPGHFTLEYCQKINFTFMVFKLHAYIITNVLDYYTLNGIELSNLKAYRAWKYTLTCIRFQMLTVLSWAKGFNRHWNYRHQVTDRSNQK